MITEFTEKQVLDFLHDIIIGNIIDPTELKSVALDLYVDIKQRDMIAYCDSGVSAKPEMAAIVKVTDRLGEFTLNYGQYLTVTRFVNEGRKLEAIKEIRTICNLGLKDSKEIVDNWSQWILTVGE